MSLCTHLCMSCGGPKTSICFSSWESLIEPGAQQYREDGQWVWESLLSKSLLGQTHLCSQAYDACISPTETLLQPLIALFKTLFPSMERWLSPAIQPFTPHPHHHTTSPPSHHIPTIHTTPSPETLHKGLHGSWWGCCPAVLHAPGVACYFTLPAANTRGHAGLISLSGPGLELWHFPASDAQVLGL